MNLICFHLLLTLICAKEESQYGLNKDISDFARHLEHPQGYQVLSSNGKWMDVFQVDLLDQNQDWANVYYMKDGRIAMKQVNLTDPSHVRQVARSILFEVWSSNGQWMDVFKVNLVDWNQGLANVHYMQDGGIAMQQVILTDPSHVRQKQMNGLQPMPDLQPQAAKMQTQPRIVQHVINSQPMPQAAKMQTQPPIVQPVETWIQDWTLNENDVKRLFDIDTEVTYSDESKRSFEPVVKKSQTCSIPVDKLRTWASGKDIQDTIKAEGTNKRGLIEHMKALYLENPVSQDYTDVTFQQYRIESGFAQLGGIVITTIPETKKGFYEQDKEKLIVDFANKQLGGGFFGNGFVQEEIIFLERYEYSLFASLYSADDNQHHRRPTLFMLPNEAWILSPVRRLRGFNKMYGRAKGTRDIQSDFKSQMVEFPQDQNNPFVIAIDAIDYSYKPNMRYKKQDLIAMIRKCYVGFMAAQIELNSAFDYVATGPLGTGAFLNDKNVMFAVQAIAANLANVKLLYHGTEGTQEKEFFREHCVGKPAYECVEGIVNSGARTGKKKQVRVYF